MKVNIKNRNFVVKQDNLDNLRKMKRCEARNRNNHSKNYHCYCGLHNIHNTPTLEESKSEQHIDNKE